MGLFKPAWSNKDIRKALAAVEKETDIATLAKIAHKAENSEVRTAACIKIPKVHFSTPASQTNLQFEHMILQAYDKLTDERARAYVIISSLEAKTT